MLSYYYLLRVWKGILGIRCGIRENAKYLDGIGDLSNTREAGFAKIWERDAGFVCLFVGNSTHEEDAAEAVPVNFLSRTVRTRTGRPITLSYRALSSY